MLPIYLIVGLLNVFSQHHNYGIKIEDPNFDIRVRRSVEDDTKPLVFNTNNNAKKYFKTNVLNAIRTRRTIQDFNIDKDIKTDVLKRKKRYAYYKKIRITNNDLYRFNNTQENKNNGSQTRNGNPYDIFNPNWNYLFNTTRTNNNTSGVNSSINNNNRPIIRSYPYGYPPGYGPKTNTGTESTGIRTTPGYRNQNTENTPYYYNYQNPNGQNFAGYIGYSNNALRTSPLASYAPRYNQPNNNASRIKPLAQYPDNLPPYAPNFNNGRATPKTTFVPYSPVNNTFVPYSPVNNTFVPYSPVNNTFVPYSPVKNTFVPYSPVNNTFVPYSPVNNTFVPYPPVNNTFVPYPPVNNTFVPYSPVNNTLVPYSPVNNTFVNNTYVTPSNLNLTITTTEKMIIATGCVICNIPCPQFMKRFGKFCVSDYDDESK